jgi:glycosyltransferase involved in cell wall biosynthesis
MKVALVHDDLVQWGGAERMLLGLTDAFPDAPIFTSAYDATHPILKKAFANKKITTSFIQKIPGWRKLYKALLPLYPIAFEQFNFDDYDVVISQSTRFAKSIITKPQTKHICYCHTPPRFLWNFSDHKTASILQPYLHYLRVYDRVSSNRVDEWVAGSKNAAERIEKIYHQKSTVIYPFVDTEQFSQTEPFSGAYLLVISRLVEYKHIALVVRASNKAGIPLKVVGDGPQLSLLQSLAGPQVEFLPRVSEEMLKLLLAGAKALVVAAEEDFGLTPLEAQALGKPVIAFKKGGALETVRSGETGYFFDTLTPGSLLAAIEELDKTGYNEKSCHQNAETFSKEKFIDTFQRLVDSGK